MRYIYCFIIILLVGTGCRQGDTKRSDLFVVSILPLKYLADNITGGNIEVKVLVPPGASPETYEPTPSQMAEIQKCSAVFTIGLIDFEHSLTRGISQHAKGRIFPTYEGVELLHGSCGHASHNHDHGVDPHIWTSPRELGIMADNMYKAIALLYPDSTHYKSNYEQLAQKLSDLDLQISQTLKASDVKTILIYHPALTYYCQQYGIEQIAIENDGKEPSAAGIKRIIERAEKDHISKVLYQSQFSRGTVEIVAKDINGQAIEIDPLREDVIANLLHITDIIAEQ